MTAAELRRWCLQHEGAIEDFPFGPATSVFKVGGKVFALSALDRAPLEVSAKCEPELAAQLRNTYPAIRPGYHLSKRHWNTITLDGTLPDQFVRDLIEDSYDLVVSALPRRVRVQLGWTASEPLLVVDGNNVMGSRPDGWWRDRAGAAKRLVAQLGEWAASAERDVLVIFDGAPPPGLDPPPRVEVRFARRRGRDAADDDIAAFVAADEAPARLRVVTSDAELARRVREHGAEVSGARELLDQL